MTEVEPPEVEPPEVEEGGSAGDEQPEPARRSRLLRDNLSVASGTAISRATGVLRFVALYAAVAPSLRDAYVLANNTPNIIYELILGGVLTATLVPLFTQHLEHHDDEATSAVVSSAIVALLVLTVLTFLTAPLLIALYGSNPGEGVDAARFRSVGTLLALLFAPQVFFYGMMAVGSALLNARKRFFAAAWAPVLNNVIVIGVLLAVPRAIGGSRDLDAAATNQRLLLLLGIGTTAGIAAMALALLPALRRAEVHIRFTPSLHHPAVRKAVALSGWTIGYVIANQIAAQTVNVLAKPGSGDVTNYSTAFMFFQLPHGLLAVSLMTTFQPDLARAVARGDRGAFNARLLQGLQLLGLVVIPAAVGYLTLAGSFAHAADSVGWTWSADIVDVAKVLAAFGIGLIGFSAYLFVLRGFYAMTDTRTPFILNCVENAFNIVLAVVLVDRWGVEGLAAAYAIAYTVAAPLSLFVLIRKHPGFDVRSLVGTSSRVFGAAAVMGVAVVGVMGVLATGSDTRIVVAAGLAIVVGVVVYVGGVVALGVPRTVGITHRRAARPGTG